MPLTSPRPGLFRGRANGITSWFVADPNAEQSAENLEREWRSHYDKTNSSRSRTVARRILPWVGAVAVLGGLGALIGLFQNLAEPYVAPLSITVGIVAVLGSLFVALAIVSWLSTDEVRPNLMYSTVLQVDPEVVRWIDLTTPVADVWRVQRALFELQQIQDAAFHWGLGLDEEAIEIPAWASATIIKPFLVEQSVAKSLSLIEVAKEVGFPVPAAVLADQAREVREYLPPEGGPDRSVVPDTV